MAHLREAEGDPQTAIALLDEAERVYVADFAPNVRPIPATRARMLAAAGETAPALAWARRSGLSADDDLTYLREYEHVTLARVLLVEAGAHCRGGPPGGGDGASGPVAGGGRDGRPHRYRPRDAGPAGPRPGCCR